MKFLFIKKISLKVLRYSGIFSLIFISALVLYFVSALIFSSISVEKEKNQPDQIPVYISTNGMHTDLIVPVKTEKIDWSQKIKYSQTAGKDSLQNFIAFGWGDREFFLNVPDWDHIKFSIALKAVSGLNTTAMHTTYLKQVEEDEDCVKIMISEKQYAQLVNYIQKYFNQDKNGNFINIVTSNAYGSTDAFYEAHGVYNLFFTCNTWTNSALKESGLKACLWTPFQQGIFNQYKKSL